MACDLCNKEEGTVLAKIEGMPYRVCSECARFGEVIPEKKEKRTGPRPKDPDLVLVSDASKRIRAARQRKDITQEELAKRLAVKASELHAWESGHRSPTIDTAKNLERHLGITLTEEADGGFDYRPPSQASGSLTIADLLKKK